MAVSNEILEQARNEAYAEAGLEVKKLSESFTKNALRHTNLPSMGGVKEKVMKARKPKLRTVLHYLCDGCDKEISKPESGFVIHGNIYVADPNQVGGVVGNNFPDKETFSIDEVQKTVLCVNCLTKALSPADEADLSKVRAADTKLSAVGEAVKRRRERSRGLTETDFLGALSDLTS